MTFDARPDRGINYPTMANDGRKWNAFMDYDV